MVNARRTAQYKTDRKMILVDKALGMKSLVADICGSANIKKIIAIFAYCPIFEHMEYLSKERYDEIASELRHLIEEVYPKVQEDLAETSAQGDRSDNAGYREARRMQGKTISRIRFLQRILEHSRVIDPGVLPKDRVCLLSRVVFTNLATNTRMSFQIVSPHEMNLEAGKISLKSPIGAALMGKKVGDIAEADVPSGKLRLRIESITLM